MPQSCAGTPTIEFSAQLTHEQAESVEILRTRVGIFFLGKYDFIYYFPKQYDSIIQPL